MHGSLTCLMKARECCKLFKICSQNLTANTQSSKLASDASSKLGATLPQRPYSTKANPAKFCGQAPAGSPSLNISTAGHVSAKNPTYSSAAAFAVRRLATTPASPSMSQKVQETAKGKMQSILAAPSAAIQTAQHSVRSTTNSVYKQLPRPAQRWVSTVSKPGGLQRALTIQLEALWQAHRWKVFGAAAIVGVYFLWKGLFGITSIFVDLSETMAEFGFLALAAAIVAFTVLYFKRLYTIDPNAVYRRALVALNTNPGVLEVMGAPLAGSEVRAYVMTGGGVRFKGWWPRYRARRVQMIFPLKGTDKRGLVSLEAKKRQGRYSFKLLAVDVPTAAGAEQRLFVDGDEKLYMRGGVMSELRDPFLRAISMQHTYEAEDEVDEAADEAAAAQEERAKQALQVSPMPEPHDGGMYFSQRVAYQARKLASRIQGSTATQPGAKAAASGWASRS
ncbi:hypothetical protein ABBQ32_001080 [Trebouxia sp. C0010 RCD-2024]